MCKCSILLLEFFLNAYLSDVRRMGTHVNINGMEISLKAYTKKDCSERALRQNVG